MTYDEVLKILFAKRGSFSRESLEVPLRFAAALGNPQSSFAAIHITGTNGKGSVATKIAKALEYAGFKVGLFTSPHLFSYCERIAVNGELIEEEKVRKSLLRLFSLSETICPDFCFFEYTTMLAFEHFRDEKVDIAVLEAGIGGRYDTTNIVTPLASVITSIGMDHAEALGATLEEIAWQKAGIIKPAAPVVVGPHADYAAIRLEAMEKQSPLYAAEAPGGFYDVENSAIAQKVLKILPLSISEEAMEKGLKARPPCRFEEIGKVILDVAHNIDGFRRLLEALDERYPKKPKLSFIIGMSEEKDIAGCLSLVAQRASRIYLVQGSTSRAAPPGKMASLLEKIGYFSYLVDQTIGQILESDQEEMLVICGTFYIMKEARELLFRSEIGGNRSFLSLR